MIIIFHYLYFVIKHGINICKKKFITFQSMQSVNLQTSGVTTDAEENLTFDPPVYKQRYGEIQSILLDNKWKLDIKKIVDFGCAEFKLFHFIKRLYRIEQILEVDIDEQLLKDNLFRIRPLTVDHICKRTEPLTVQILCGSISDPDCRLLDADVVIGIEIIEHLYPDTLEAVPYNIFGIIKPKIAIFTTPNSDFNIVFPNFKGFRHDDHKFEWSREQFESWAINITNRFPEYSVSFKGIGQGPKRTEHLGCCSQMAVFVKECNSKTTDTNYHIEGSADVVYKNCACKNCVPQDSLGICTYFSYTNTIYKSLHLPATLSCEKDCGDYVQNITDKYYKIIEIIEYPYDIDERSPEQKILDELQYRIRLMGNINGRFYNEEQNRIEIPLIELVFNQYTHFTTVEEAGEILEKAGFKLEGCIVCDKRETCIIYEPDMESRSSTPTSRSHDSDADKEFYSEWTVGTTDADASDWEVDNDIQKGAWVVDLSDQESQQTEAFQNATYIVDSIVSNAELLATTQESSGQKQYLKKAALSYEEEGKTCSNSEGNCESTNLMYDSGYYKSNTNLTSSPQSYSDTLDTDILDDQVNTNLEANKLGKQQVVPVNITKCNKEQIILCRDNLDKMSSEIRTSNHILCESDVQLIEAKKSESSITTYNIENGKNFVNSKINDKKRFVVTCVAPVGDLEMTLESKTIAPSNIYANKANNLKDGMREPVPGTSDVKKKKKPKKFDSDDDDSTASSLKNENIERRVIVDGREERRDDDILEVLGIAQIPEPIVENGDLANNNRDLEGNNYPNAQQVDQQQNENDNEHVVLQNNVNLNGVVERNEDVENRNDIEEEEANNDGELDRAHVIQDEILNDNLELEFASREALFDPNSQVDLLEDFHIPDPIMEALDQPLPQNVIIVSLGPTDTAASHIGPAITVDAEPFPNWLLHLLGAEYMEDDEHHDEPHFYCQGDGIGVHPSFIQGDMEDDHSSSDSDSTSTGTSSNGSTANSNTDEAEAIPTVSDADVGSLPEDVNDAIVVESIVAPVPVAQTTNTESRQAAPANNAGSSSGTESADEFFDSLEETLSLSSAGKSE